MSPLGGKGVAIRFVAALALVAATWNPTGTSFYHWVRDSYADSLPLAVFLGLILLVVWVVFLRATTRSLGVVGITLAVALSGSLLWLLLDAGWIDPTNSTALSWIVLVLLAAVLAAGMSWSHLRRRMAGQADVDDIDQ